MSNYDNSNVSLHDALPIFDFAEPSNALHLQAVAPGNASFSVFRPNVKDVFAFTDDGSDAAGNPLLTGPNQTIYFSYVVVRKSTRLNSSHRCISYDVFCLKK